MLKKSYLANYFKIYLWQGLSLVLNFLSMLIVLPYLTKNPSIYGIYTVCASISIFLAYADIGFIGAGQKYAAEHFARGEMKGEIEVIGFTSFVLLIFLILFSVGFFLLSLYPDFLIKNLKPGKEFSVASSLFFILGLFTPVTLLQRLLQMIFGIRLEDYIVQRIYIIGSLFKISSVLWFFRNDQYNIVGYFLFVQVVNLLSASIALLIAKKLYAYDFKRLLMAMRFNSAVFSRTKSLAFTSLYLTIAWISYYELDPIIIGKFIGVSQVALYAIGLTLLSFFRTIFGILFSPINARFNHFIGINDLSGLKSFYLHVTTILTPLVIIPILTISLLAKPIILSWVGSSYIESVMIAKLLILCNLFAFITYPVGMLLMAQERVKEMYFVNTLLPVAYWGGIILTYSFLGLKSFAVFKLFAFIVSAVVYYFIMLKFLKINIVQSLKEIFKPIVVPIIFLIITTLVLRDFLPFEKSKLNLLIVFSVAGCLIFTSFVLQYFTSSRIRIYVKKVIFENNFWNLNASEK